MPIATAVGVGQLVHAYGEDGEILFSLVGKLHGYTASYVAVRIGDAVQVYDETKTLKFTVDTES